MQITRRCLCAGPAVSAARGLAVTVQVFRLQAVLVQMLSATSVFRL